jgi:uncharacterized protein
MATIASTASDLPHETTGPRAAPAAKRIETLDFVRGVALFGILLMNITGFGLPHAYTNPVNAGGATGINLVTWMITEIGFEGTQRALFSMLFGASVILFTSRLEAEGRTDVGDIYVRRNLWLVGFGMVNAWVLLWEGDILYMYGIIALFVFAFRKLPARTLLVIGGAALLANAAWNAHDALDTIGKYAPYQAAVGARGHGARLTQAQQSAIIAWEDERGNYKETPSDQKELVDGIRGGYWSAFGTIAPHNTWAQSRGLYRFFFDVFSMMLIGMALFRMGVLTLERPTRLYVAMLVLGYAVGLTVNTLETRWIVDHRFSAIAFAQVSVSYDLGRLAMAVGHLGGLLLFARSGIFSWLRRSLAAVGQMAVTNYLTHSLVALVLFILMRWFGAFERHQLYYVVFAIWAAQLVASTIWLRHYRFGPVEWLWRYLTYLKRPPFRREAPATA